MFVDFNKFRMTLATEAPLTNNQMKIFKGNEVESDGENMDYFYCWLKCIKSCSFKFDEITKVYEGDLMKCKISNEGVQFELKENHYSFPYEIGRIAECFKIAYQDE